MRWHPFIPAIAACVIASPALFAKPVQGFGAWIRFDDTTSLEAARAIVASDVPGDATLASLSVNDGMLVVTGSLGLDNGSRWATLGAEIAPASVEAGADMSGASVLRIRLASAVARPLRVRIKGGDRETGNAGCYPVVVQMVAKAPAEYLIPLSAFRAQSWCGQKGMSIEQTLRAVERVEVTANDAPAGTVNFSVGRIDFLADDWNAPDRNLRLAWGDEFEGERRLPASSEGWRTNAVSARGVALDGLGHLQLHPGAGGTGVSIRSSADHPILHGRTEVRLQVAETAAGDRPASLRVALQASSPGTPALVLLEGNTSAEGFTAGLAGTDTPFAALRMRTRVTTPMKAHFVTVACDREADRIRWLIDGIVVQELTQDELPAAAWAALEQAPLALDISVNGGDVRNAADGGAAVLVDSVRFWQPEEAPGATASVSPAASRGAARASASASGPTLAAAPRRKPVPAGQPASVVAAAPSKRVTCEYSARYELMLCY